MNLRLRYFVLPFFFFLFSAVMLKSQTGIPVYKPNSVLSSGEWYRFSVDKTGIYCIGYNDLLQWGINPGSINPKNIKIYGNGGAMLPELNSIPVTDDLNENSIFIKGENDGVFNSDDYILFYATSPHVWNYDSITDFFSHSYNLYSEVSCYFLNISEGAGKRVAEDTVNQIHNGTVHTFNDYMFHEKDSVNLLKSGKEWYGEYFNQVRSYTFNFNFPNIVETSKLKLKTNIAARNTLPSELTVTSGTFSGSVLVSAIPGQYTSDYARYSVDTFSFYPSGANISLKIDLNTMSSIAWMNYIDINCERNLIFSGHQLPFRNTSCIGPGNVTLYELDYSFIGKKIWNVSDPSQIKEKQISMFLNVPGFKEHTDNLQEFIAFDSLDILKPVFIEKLTPQNLHALQPRELIIITYPAFIDQAQRLALLHTQYDGVSSLIVTPQQIYNEFSSGIQDVSAIRNFMRMLYHKEGNPADKTKYLLLMGDGSYDYKNRISENSNFIPTYESINSLMPTSSYLSDDFFGLMDSTEGYLCNGNLDIGIGRFPCVKEDEVKSIVDKIEKYLTRYNIYSEVNGCTLYETKKKGDWRNTVCFIGDDEDNNLHLSQANDLSNIVDTGNLVINVKKIFLDAYPQVTGPSGSSYPQVNKLINEQVNEGALVINYTGHGGEESLAGEKIVQFSDIYQWKNLTNLPVFVTATCEFSRFDDPARHSAGELILTKPDGGGIALYTTTRLAFSNSNFSLNKSFYKFALKRDSTGKYLRMGDIIRKVKVDNNSIVNVRNFVLLGDPALQLSLPDFNVKTKTINGMDADLFSDTLTPGSLVQVSGEIQDVEGNLLDDFNGIVYPTVFDQKIWQTTLGNDPQSIPYNFSTQEAPIYKGAVSVLNGMFEFSYLVPKDIAQSSGISKISYYAEDSLKNNASGYYEPAGFLISGNDTSVSADNLGPMIKPYINTTAFLSGGSSDPNPLLKVFLYDISGINALGLGIGHEITCVLDSDMSAEIVLNNYFDPELNSYTSGWVTYPLKNLDYGLHTIRIKAWDLMNNSSEAEIDFIVAPPTDINISKMLVYPNPFTNHTNFYFEHNQPCCEMELQIQICTISGQQVKLIKKNITAGFHGIIPVTWDGTTENGSTLADGMYVYRLKALSSDGSYIERSGKLIYLK